MIHRPHRPHNHCDHCGELTINPENEYGEFVCESCEQNRAEAAYERHCEAFHDGGATQFKTLQQQQIEARRAEMKRTNHSYFVVMQDFDKRGLEANVHPEDTRRDVVSMLASGELKNVAFIHRVAFGSVSDVTDELFEAAELLVREVA